MLQKFYSYFNERGAKSLDEPLLVVSSTNGCPMEHPILQDMYIQGVPQKITLCFGGS